MCKVRIYRKKLLSLSIRVSMTTCLIHQLGFDCIICSPLIPMLSIVNVRYLNCTTIPNLIRNNKTLKHLHADSLALS